MQSVHTAIHGIFQIPCADMGENGMNKKQSRWYITAGLNKTCDKRKKPEMFLVS